MEPQSEEVTPPRETRRSTTCPECYVYAEWDGTAYKCVAGHEWE